MKISDAINEVIERRNKLDKLLSFIAANKDILEREVEEGERGHWSLFGESLDLNFPSRDLCMTVLRHFGGKWDKDYQNEKINYSREIDGVTVRIYNVDPPQNCKIVEETIDVPEQVVAAHKKTVRKLVCKETVTVADLEEVAA